MALADRSASTVHRDWLACLYVLLRKLRLEGLVSLEADIDGVGSESSVFRRFPRTLEPPYLEFATDLLRLMTEGHLDPDHNQRYVDHYIEGLLAGTSPVDESVLQTIWLTLWACMKGYDPLAACEFGRKAIPVGIKPSFAELRQLLSDAEGHVQK